MTNNGFGKSIWKKERKEERREIIHVPHTIQKKANDLKVKMKTIKIKQYHYLRKYYYLGFKKEEIVQYASTWRNPEDVMLRETSQSH